MSGAPTPENRRIGDNPEIKALYREFDTKLKRLHAIACNPHHIGEFEELKKKMETIYARMLLIAG